MMPRLDGLGLLARLREDPTTRSLPVVLLSARAGEESRVEGLEAGADDYLTKPFTARELVARVRANLEINRLRKETVRVEERLRNEERMRDVEAQKREFYKRTILAATEGKLVISEREEIEAIACEKYASWTLRNLSDVAAVRDRVGAIARQAGISEQRARKYVGCVLEAAGNAVKHTGGGKASLHRTKDSLILVVSDSGPGIGAMSLPDVALTHGYSTAGTLGMGYKLMIRFADRVYLATGSDGTTVAVEMKLQEPPVPGRYGLPQQLTAWPSGN
jgi:anti-sigma regulatory factor (Ser/Thr protein kinase)